MYGYTHDILLENKLILSQANIPDGKNEYQWDAWDALIKGFGMHIKVTSIKNGMRLKKLMGRDWMVAIDDGNFLINEVVILLRCNGCRLMNQKVNRK